MTPAKAARLDLQSKRRCARHQRSTSPRAYPSRTRHGRAHAEGAALALSLSQLRFAKAHPPSQGRMPALVSTCHCRVNRRRGYLSLRRRVVQVRKSMPLIINQSITYQNSTQMNQRAGREGTGKVSPLTLLCQDARRLALGAEGANTRARHGGREASAKCQRSHLSIQRESVGTLRGGGSAMNRDDACKGSASRFAIETALRPPPALDLATSVPEPHSTRSRARRGRRARSLSLAAQIRKATNHGKPRDRHRLLSRRRASHPHRLPCRCSGWPDEGHP